MLNRLMTAGLVVLVCASVSQAITLVPGYTENFEGCAGGNITACGYSTTGNTAAGLQSVNDSGSFNGTNVAHSKGSTRILHGVDLTSPIVYVAFDAVFNPDDNWAGLNNGAASEAGLSVGQTNSFNGLFGVDLRRATDDGGNDSGAECCQGYRGPLNNTLINPAHYELVHNRTDPNVTTVTVTVTDPNNPATVYDSQLYVVPPAGRDRIEQLTYMALPMSNANGTQIDNIEVGTPEPSTMALLGLGAGLLAFRRRRSS
jgi:hypothetical protein